MTRRDEIGRRIFGTPDPKSDLVEAVVVLADEVRRRRDEARDAPGAGSFDGGSRRSTGGPLDAGAEMNASIREAAQRHSGALWRAERVNVVLEEEKR